MLFEDIIEDIGGFGKFQIRLFVIVSLFEAPSSWIILLPVFVSTPNPIVCLTDNITDICNNASYCSNLTYTHNYKNSIISEWNLSCDQAYIPTLISTLQMVGLLIGAGITGQFADMYGRKITLYLVYAGMLIATLVSSLATTWQLYAVCRALVGAFFGGTMVVNFVMPMEFLGKSWRTYCGNSGSWALGVMTFSLMSYYVTEWRYLTALTSGIGFLLLPTYWMIPESPRWLILKGRSEEAKKIILDMAKTNGKEFLDETKLALCIKDSEKACTKKYGYWNLFRTPIMTRNALIIMFFWFVCGSVYYGSTMSVGSLTGSAHLNLFLSGLVEIPAIVTVIFINNRIGRRWTLFSLMSLAGLSYVVILSSIWTDKSLNLIRIAALVGKLGITGSWSAAQIYSAEVFPTVIRNVGIASCSMSARIGIITVPEMIEMSDTVMYMWCGGITLTAALLSFLLPETLNKCLPDFLPPLEWPCCGVSRSPTPHPNADVKFPSADNDTPITSGDTKL